MFKRFLIILIIFLFTATGVEARESIPIEIFSIYQEKVVKTLPMNNKIQNLLTGYVHGIDGLYGKFNPIPKEGYAIKILLEPYVKINNKWLNQDVDQVIIVFPKNEAPFLIIFEKETKLLCFTFKGNVDTLLKELNFQLDK